MDRFACISFPQSSYIFLSSSNFVSRVLIPPVLQLQCFYCPRQFSLFPCLPYLWRPRSFYDIVWVVKQAVRRRYPIAIHVEVVNERLATGRAHLQAMARTINGSIKTSGVSPTASRRGIRVVHFARNVLLMGLIDPYIKSTTARFDFEANATLDLYNAELHRPDQAFCRQLGAAFAKYAIHSVTKQSARQCAARYNSRSRNMRGQKCTL